jgi:hypothetical protein
MRRKQFLQFGAGAIAMFSLDRLGRNAAQAQDFADFAKMSYVLLSSREALIGSWGMGILLKSNSYDSYA